MIAKISGCAFGTALLSLLLCLPAQARQVEVSTSVLCNTEQQMERFVVLFDGDNEKAINGVNSEENDPHACVSGTIAYIRGPEIATARSSRWTFNIVECLLWQSSRRQASHRRRRRPSSRRACRRARCVAAGPPPNGGSYGTVQQIACHGGTPRRSPARRLRRPVSEPEKPVRPLPSRTALHAWPRSGLAHQARWVSV